MNKKIRIVTLISILIFILLMLPVVYLSFVNRATGDDYNYGIYTRAAWVGTHSLAEVCRQAWWTVRQFYTNWQGTWFSIFLFTLQPEVFSDNAYVIVAFLMLFAWIGSTFYLFKQILCRNIRLNRWSYLLITVCFLIIGIEFVPSTKSAIYWYNGCAHYLLPFAMCQMVAAWLLQYQEEYKKHTYIAIVIFMTLLGGSNYQAALFVLIAACYTQIAVWVLKKDKRILTLLLPVCTELAGLIMSMKAPGNKVRAGEEFGFSILKGIETIGKSFLYGITDIGKYWQERPLVLVGLLFLFILFTIVFCAEEKSFSFAHPIWLSLMLYCLYSAMQAPAVYAEVEVSGGVPNMNFQVFLLTASGILLITANTLAGKMRAKWQEDTDKKVLKMIAAPGIVICFLLTFLCRSNIKTSTSYVALIYAVSGQAADYKEQMDLQTRLMEDEGVEDVVVPFINDVQGPLMHMPITEDSDSFTSWATAQFYGKNSVIAIDRSKWMEENQY